MQAGQFPDMQVFRDRNRGKCPGVSTLRSRAHEKLLRSFDELALTQMSALSAPAPRGISANSNPFLQGRTHGRERGWP